MLLSIAFQGCITRNEIKVKLWKNNGFPIDLCEKYPEILNYGFYRRLNTGKLELISFCKPEARAMFSITSDDLNELLNETIPNEN